MCVYSVQKGGTEYETLLYRQKDPVYENFFLASGPTVTPRIKSLFDDIASIWSAAETREEERPTNTHRKKLFLRTLLPIFPTSNILPGGNRPLLLLFLVILPPSPPPFHPQKLPKKRKKRRFFSPFPFADLLRGEM